MATILEKENAKAEEFEEQIRQKQTILSGLHAGVVKVEFTKKDGTNRTMICTLNKQYLPEQTDIEETTKTKSSEAVAVWDLEKDAWRSFRWDSVKSYTTGVSYET